MQNMMVCYLGGGTKCFAGDAYRLLSITIKRDVGDYVGLCMVNCLVAPVNNSGYGCAVHFSGRWKMEHPHQKTLSIAQMSAQQLHGTRWWDGQYGVT